MFERLLRAIGNISHSAADTARTTSREINHLMGIGSVGYNRWPERRMGSGESHSAEKSNGPVATPMPDRMVSLKDEPSLLSPDFDQERAMTDAKFNAFQKGMKQMEEKKN